MKDKNMNIGESIVFENKTDSAFDVSAGVVFHKSGIYEVSILKNKTIVSKVTERKRGEWIPYEFGDETWHQCTACGVADKYIDYVKGYDGETGKLVSVRNYCPNCGADMRGEEDAKRVIL